MLQHLLHPYWANFWWASVTPSNADNLSAARCPVSLAKEPIVFLTRVEVEAILKWEKETASPAFVTCWDSYPSGYSITMLQKFDCCWGNTRENVVRSIDSMGPSPIMQISAFETSHIPPWCKSKAFEFSKSSNDRTYTWYVNIKPRSIHDWEHILSIFNSKIFYAETKVSLV